MNNKEQNNSAASYNYGFSVLHSEICTHNLEKDNQFKYLYWKQGTKVASLGLNFTLFH